MAIQYTYEKKDEILYALGSGVEESLKQDQEVTLEVIEVSRSFGCTKLLMDDRNVAYTSSITSLYELAKSYSAKAELYAIRKIAVVADSKYKEDNDFYESAVRNRGLNLRIFYSIEKAEDWLLE
ncbi:MAG TPA: hypothetical protein VHM28_02185 [Anaerolineales bacterium]|jgi:hypothetical protein|nr:hypothetical protein [Anaerolineales bacterium]